MPVAAFGLTVELREGDDGDVQFPCDGFDAAGDFADLLLAAFGAGIIHQLHVVDHDQLDVVLKLQAARLGAKLEDRQAR